MWGSFFAEVQDESARVANTIAEFEPVTMVAADEAGAAVARRRLHPATDIRVIPMDGSWSRDNGPNYVTDGEIVPLDTEFAPIFKRHNLQLRNCIIWHFGHGLHTRRRFSGRYEVVL